jgi:hypothetical protein
VTGLVTLRTPGRCHCVPCRHRLWWGPRVPLSRDHGVVPHSPRLVAQYAPLILAPVSALDFHPRPRTGPPLFSFLLGTVARTSPGRANPVPSFLPFLTQARTWSAPWPIPSPPCDPSLVISPLRRLHFRCATPPPPFTSFKMSPCLLLLHSTHRSGVELIVSTSSVISSDRRSSKSNQVGEGSS